MGQTGWRPARDFAFQANGVEADHQPLQGLNHLKSNQTDQDKLGTLLEWRQKPAQTIPEPGRQDGLSWARCFMSSGVAMESQLMCRGNH